MMRALCNAITDGPEHTHICKLDKRHTGETHLCSCGTLFAVVKQEETERPLAKAN